MFLLFNIGFYFSSACFESILLIFVLQRNKLTTLCVPSRWTVQGIDRDLVLARLLGPGPLLGNVAPRILLVKVPVPLADQLFLLLSLDRPFQI